MKAALELRDVGKSFTMHLQGGLRLSVLSGISFSVQPGECVVLGGRSGLGKSTVLKMIFGNYRCDDGQILVRRGGEVVDIATATARQMLALRQHTIGYVAQFLRTVPRVPAVDVVAEPLVLSGMPPEAARGKATDMLRQLNIPERALAPSSGHFLRRRTAARQHRSRADCRPSDPAARRTHRLARRGQSRAGAVAACRTPGGGHRNGRHFPRWRGAQQRCDAHFQFAGTK